MRVPVLDVDYPEDIGGTLLRYTMRFSPGQDRFHGKPLSELQKLCYRQLGHYDVLYCPKEVLGKNSILKLFKKGADMLRLREPPKFGGHALQSIYIQKLSNDPRVSPKECMVAARHNSVATQEPYIQSTNETKTTKLEALGFKKPAAVQVGKPNTRGEIDFHMPTPRVQNVIDNLAHGETNYSVSDYHAFWTHMECDLDNFYYLYLLSQRHGL